MPRKSGAWLAGVLFLLAASALVGFAGVNPAWAQIQPPAPQLAPAAQSAIPAIPGEPPSASQVLPEGGFPTSPPSPEGGIPAPAAQLGVGGPYPALQPPSSDYAPFGLYPRGVQEAPGVPEFYHPISD